MEDKAKNLFDEDIQKEAATLMTPIVKEEITEEVVLDMLKEAIER